MSISTLGEFRQSISRSMIASFLVIALLSFFVLFVTHQNYEKWMRQGDRQQIKNAIAIYQSNLSEKLSIVANSTTFVDFLRSGKETRKSLLPDLRYELSNVDFTNTAGMVVANRGNDILFQQGSKSDYPVTLLLCYLNRTLHEMGECNYNWTLFLSKESIIQQLQRINSRIEECQSCGSVNFLKDKNFGSFVVQNSFPFELNIKIKRQDQYIIYFYALFILGVLIVFTIWNRYRIKYIVNRYIANPIENITSVLFSGKIVDEKDKYINEISYLLERLQFWQIETQKAEGQKHEAAIGRLTSQVVHDIRSPLTALDIAIKSTASMPEAERMLIRNAALRINDIANNLLTQYKQKNLEIDQHPALKPELIADICLNVISEKRIQMKNIAVELVVTIDDNTHGSFANIVSSELQRALSNLIENAMEAISGKGLFTFSLRKTADTLTVSIQDTGCGIPKQILPDILNGQLSLKKQGAGLGLARAKKTIEEWNCKFTIQSTVNVGTLITILFPIVEPPQWFAPQLSIKRYSTVIIVDDDASIHDVWANRFKPYAQKDGIKLIQLRQCSDLMNWQPSAVAESVTYLVDYEFLQEQENGLAIIQRLGIGKQAHLVTSHYENPDVQQQALQSGTTIIPKRCAAYIPIQIL